MTWLQRWWPNCYTMCGLYAGSKLCKTPVTSNDHTIILQGQGRLYLVFLYSPFHSSNDSFLSQRSTTGVGVQGQCSAEPRPTRRAGRVLPTTYCLHSSAFRLSLPAAPLTKIMIQSLICKRDGIGGPIGLFMGIFNSSEPLLPLSPRNLFLGLGIPFFIGIGFVPTQYWR